MNKIIEYHIFYYENIYDLSNEVNNAIKKGLQPLGGICVYKSDRVYQAMVKYEEHK